MTIFSHWILMRVADLLTGGVQWRLRALRKLSARLHRLSPPEVNP